MSLVGHEVTRSGDGLHVETVRWIGKPWRRVEVVTNDFYWQGKRDERFWDITVRLGIRRLGFFVHWTLTYAPAYDFSEERP